MDAGTLIDNIACIRTAAGSGIRRDGGCMVAPHPDLNKRIRAAMKDLSIDELPGIVSLRPYLPTAPGLNDGVIVPPERLPLEEFGIFSSRPSGPLRGKVRVVVVLVNYVDEAIAQTRKHFEDLFFSEGVIPTRSVREYYKEATGGLIELEGVVAGPFTLPQSGSFYANGCGGMGRELPNGQTMARDTALAAKSSIDFSPFDNDGNGVVDAFVIVHPGTGAEVVGDKTRVWSHKWTLQGGAMRVNGKDLFGYLTIPEDCRIGVCAHELGHLLFAFPDLYDADLSSEGVGDWCLMGGGSWGGGGDTPVHPSAWCKLNQGWIAADAPSADGQVLLADVKESGKALKLWKNGAARNEYFLVENRQRTGFDVSLPGAGLLIWHVDESIAGNTDESHYKVALVQADNLRSLERRSDPENRGDDGDPYPGRANNTSFDASSHPSSRSHAGADTCVALTDIGPSGAVMTAMARVKG